ncbi:hypothetical protein ABVK25_008440 [Lepraria finkii]|uniref:Uncharacterized protein n=1 Tax=Lepraria finkii TaxID=1340010 RepID=A0ABR4AZX1_9LECA
MDRKRVAFWIIAGDGFNLLRSRSSITLRLLNIGANQLAYGYYLSRPGILEDAAHFLTSGLQYNLASLTPLQLFNYLFELISVYLRLDQWKDAGKLLARIEKHVLPGNEGMEIFDFWARSGKYGEIRTLLDLYQADYLMATGNWTRQKIGLQTP